jgi:hypothetical protein
LKSCFLKEFSEYTSVRNYTLGWLFLTIIAIVPPLSVLFFLYFFLCILALRSSLVCSFFLRITVSLPSLTLLYFSLLVITSLSHFFSSFLSIQILAKYVDDCCAHPHVRLPNPIPLPTCSPWEPNRSPNQFP